MKHAYFWRFLLNIVFGFKSTNKKFAFNELTNLKVLIVKFQVSSLDLYFGSMLINLSCKSASKPLNAQYCT